jgi:heptosyltransferase-1
VKSGLIAWLTGAKERVGFSSEVLQEKANRLFTTRRIPFRSEDRNVTDRYLRVVSALFDRDYRGMNLTGDILSAPNDEAAAERYLAELPTGRVFMFQVGTTWSTKLWYPEGLIELGQRIVARYPDATILINWGSPEEQALGERIVAEVGTAVRLLPWLRIRELIPVIRRVDVLIGGDTGPLYLAAAVGTPTVSYFRATSAATYAPQGERHRSVQAPLPCAGCGRTSCDRDAECRVSISVDVLFDALAELIGH